MSNGINVANITFDANGEILGLADDVLAAISAGAKDLDTSNSVLVQNGAGCNSCK